MDFLHSDEHDLDPPFNRLTSEQPNIPIQNIDITRRPLGFGNVAMKKLVCVFNTPTKQYLPVIIFSVSSHLLCPLGWTFPSLVQNFQTEIYQFLKESFNVENVP